jgi:S1-C subfamily serine protease
VTGIDWIIVVFVAALAVLGYQQGLIVGALSLGGFIGGAALGSRLGPALLEEGSKSPYAPLTALIGGLLVGGIAAVALEGLAHVVRGHVVRTSGVDILDGTGGAVLLIGLALAFAWIFGAVALHTPGARDLRTAVQRSVILRRLNDLVPPSGPLLNILNRIDPTPSVTGPGARVEAPNTAIANDPDVRAAGNSVVRVLGTACGLGVSGSGWVAAPRLVVTNAHVVAGEDDTTVTPPGDEQLDVTPVHFDPRNDLAVLRVDGLDAPPLDISGSTTRGTEGAVLGYPENGPFTIAPARIGRTASVISQDAYGRGPVRRDMTSFRANVRSGDSGGPVVDGAGRVLTTVFAAAVGEKPPSGLGVPDAVVRRALSSVSGPVDTGPCTR